MIHYNVWFSFKAGTVETDELGRVSAFLTDLGARGLIADFTLLRNRQMDAHATLPPFHAIIRFENNEQFGRPFADVAAAGIHLGKHGAMIANVDRFVVEIFETMDE